ncbi:hypothetical protein HGRIS_010211 [Hohenbuehelia grisea]|uniref:WW domain-containing protein n=1 Tax=Hohenbuehelia grisea TaxID=104357 RepID=A0ABR3J3K6_9AGAR
MCGGRKWFPTLRSFRPYDLLNPLPVATYPWEAIASHHGSKTGALFEIEWASGDTTWLPYHQVSHLQALKSYFEALGISDISQLQNGTGVPPGEDPQVFSGSVLFTEPSLSYKNPSPTTLKHYHLLRSFPLPTRRSQNMSSTTSLNFTHFMCTDRGNYTLTDPETTYVTTYTRDQINAYVKFDKVLRGGKYTASVPVPAGYIKFARIYNLEPNVKSKFTLFDEITGQPQIQGPIHGLASVLPDAPPEALATAFVMAHPISKNRAKPYDLSARRRQLVDELLWESLESNIRQKKKKEEFIAARRAAKAARNTAPSRLLTAPPTSTVAPSQPVASSSSVSDNAMHLDDPVAAHKSDQTIEPAM